MNFDQNVSNGITSKGLIELMFDGDESSYLTFKNTIQARGHPSQDPSTFSAFLAECLDVYHSNMNKSKLYAPMTKVYNFILEHLVVDFNIPNDKRMKSIVDTDNLVDNVEDDACPGPDDDETQGTDLCTKMGTIIPFANVDEGRGFCVSIIRKYENMSDLGVTGEFMDGIVQIMTCLHDINKEEIRHGDVSMSNMMYYRKGEEVVVVLIDFDLATYTLFDKDPTSDHRTGTAPFMAYELLRFSEPKRGLRHDLESCIHCVFWNSVGYKDDRKQNGRGQGKHAKAMTHFGKWRAGSCKDMGSAKAAFYSPRSSAGYIDYLKEVNAEYADICEQLVELLWAEYIRCEHGGKVRYGRPSVLQGFRLTYARIMEAINCKLSCNEACCQ